MPSAEIIFFLSVKPIYFTDIIFSVSACQMQKKKLECWHNIYMSINEILIFGLIFLIFRYHWHNNFMSAIKSSNRSLLVFFDPWRVFFTSVASILCFYSFICSGPDITSLRQHSFLPGADIFFLCHCNDFLRFSCTDICFLCQWSEFLKKLVFSYHWHKDFMSATP